MDAGLKGRIKGFDAVGGQEQDALEVFQESKKDADKCIPGNVLRLPSLCSHMSAAIFIQAWSRAIPRKTSASSKSKTAPMQFVNKTNAIENKDSYKYPMNEQHLGSC